MEHLEWAEHVDFADELKRLCQVAYGAQHCQVYGTDVEKNTLVSGCNLTGRVLMQRLGSAMRTIWPECWVHAWERSIQERMAKHGMVPMVTCDVRYPNELQAIHRLGGIVIRLTRAPHQDAHESETGLDDVNSGDPEDGLYFDEVIDNARLTVDETNAEALRLCREAGIV
jgi:hypothetical protein